MELGTADDLTKLFGETELLGAISGRLARFQHLKPDYGLRAGGLGAFLRARDDRAALVGTAPESLIRTLGEFNYRGLIEMVTKHIRVVQPEKLRRAYWQGAGWL